MIVEEYQNAELLQVTYARKRNEVQSESCSSSFPRISKESFNGSKSREDPGSRIRYYDKAYSLKLKLLRD